MNAASTHPLAPRHNRYRRRRLVGTPINSIPDFYHEMLVL
jgi:hypothetical protein